MTETIIVPQIESTQENRGDRQAKLYEAIRMRISESFFSRIKIDEEELLHAIFMKLVDRFLPPFGSEEMTALLDDEMLLHRRRLRPRQNRLPLVACRHDNFTFSKPETKMIDLNVLIDEPAEVYHAKAKEFLSSHQAAFCGSETRSMTEGKAFSETIFLVERRTPVNWMDPSREISFDTACRGINVDAMGISSYHPGGGLARASFIL